MQVLSKPATKVVKRTAGGTGSWRKGESRAKTHGEKGHKPSSGSQSGKESSGQGSQSASGGPAGGTLSKESIESLQPAKNVWEQRKEERESQEREANRDVPPKYHVSPAMDSPSLDVGFPSGGSYPIGSKRQAEETSRSSRGGRGLGVQHPRNNRTTREFISQSRRVRGASTVAGRAPRVAVPFPSRRGGSVPTGPSHRSRTDDDVVGTEIEEFLAEPEKNAKSETKEEDSPKEEKRPVEPSVNENESVVVVSSFLFTFIRLGGRPSFLVGLTG